MSQDYDAIDEVKPDRQEHQENEVKTENNDHSLRDSSIEMDSNQNHLSSEQMKPDLDLHLVQSTSIISDDQPHSHVSGLEFFESIRKEEKNRKKEKLYKMKEKTKYKGPDATIKVPGSFYDRTCSQLGLVMLCLSLILIFLGGYALAKGASLACLGAGLWAGAAAAVCGGIASLWTAPANTQGCIISSVPAALPVKGISSSASEANLANTLPHQLPNISGGYALPYGVASSTGIGRAMAALLVSSLISLAMSILALALTGIGVLRDAHRLATGTTTEAVIWVGSVLVFCLVLDCGCCLRAVYHAALTLRIRKCQEKQRLKDLAGERGLYAQQQAWLSCPLTPSTVAASVIGQQFHQQLCPSKLPKHGSTLANRAGLVRMWLGKQSESHAIPIQSPIPSLASPHVIMPQIIPGSIQRSSKRHDASSRMRPASDPINLPFDYVKNVVGSQTMNSSMVSKSQAVKPDLTYSGLDRVIADSFIKSYNKPESNAITDTNTNLNADL